MWEKFILIFPFNAKAARLKVGVQGRKIGRIIRSLSGELN
jgi:hypothetical protein